MQNGALGIRGNVSVMDMKKKAAQNDCNLLFSKEREKTKYGH